MTHRSPVAQHAVEIGAAHRRTRKVEAARASLSHLESLPDEICGATPDGNDACTEKYGHAGEHNWRRIGEGEEDGY